MKSSGTDYATEWATVSGGGGGTATARRSRMMSGAIYTLPTPTGIGTMVTVAGTMYLVPFPVDVPPPSGVNGIGVRIGSNIGAGTGIALGIYADTGQGFPGARLVDAGTIAPLNTNSDKWQTIAWSPTADLYWLAVLPLGGTPTLFSMTGWSGQDPMLYGVSGAALSGVQGGGALTLPGQSALPATFPSSGWAVTANAPRPYLRTA